MIDVKEKALDKYSYQLHSQRSAPTKAYPKGDTIVASQVHNTAF